ncbi:uncharacterized protein LOC111630434 [Centruroides sculpturatus]|uniref:uncharacterized protein LOC111630434 n=1 Tax=Centruroides sculpturatus TaxID=218467 RepID=UPI000C6E28BB|nr:uncharacterized protein LOC111630434 [Centruroides sculpturatus]
MDVLLYDMKCEAPWGMLLADDIVLCELSQTKAEEKLEDQRKVLKERDMMIRRTKTAYMTLNGRDECNIKIKSVLLPLVLSFKYLGSFVEMGGGLNSEMQHRKHRIQCGWMNWRKLSGVLCNKKVSYNLKGKLYKSVVRPAMLYGAETWARTKVQERKMEVVKIRMLRWMCEVSRKNRIRNDFIRGYVTVGPLSKKMQECRLRWFGHEE